METKPTNFESMPALLTPNDLALITGRSAQTIRRLLRDGKLPAIKIGRSWYCPKADFEHYVRGCAYGLLP